MIPTYYRTTASGEPLASAYLHHRAGARGIPLAGTFELTARCNFNCKMCYVHHNAEVTRELSAQSWIDLGRTAAQNGMLFLLLTGGEPLLRKDFSQIYAALKKLGLMISINTNGSLISDEILQLFAEFPPSRVNISLYGGCNRTYQALCGNPAYNSVTENIKKLRALNIGVKLNCSVTPDNAADIQDIFAFGREVNVPVQATTYMFPPVRINGGQYGAAPARFDPQQAAHYQLVCREQYMTAAQLSVTANSALQSEEDCGLGEFGPMRCRAGRSSFWVTWDGRMLPCGMFPTDGHSIPAMGFESAWQAVRQDTQAVELPRECSGCSKRDRCTACAASCLAENGDTRIKPQYICDMMQKLDDLTIKKYGKESPV